MQRSEVVQGALDCFSKPKYLEIGVDQGQTFHALRAAKRVAVDPSFKFDVPPQSRGSGLEYHEVTSDVYFQQKPESDTFDVIYIDGLHTFDQTLRDLMNSLSSLSSGGVIIVDDVMPTTYTSSLPSLDDVFFVRAHLPSEAHDGSWMGDVYRLVFFVAFYMPAFKYATVAENHGQLVMWKDKRESLFNDEVPTIGDISLLNFPSMLRQRHIFNIRPYAEILGEFKARKT